MKQSLVVLWLVVVSCFTATLHASDVIEAQFHQRYALLADDDVAGYMGLAQWCQDHQLNEEAQQLYRRVLSIAPGHRDAYTSLNSLAPNLPLPEQPVGLSSLVRQLTPHFARHVSRHFVVVHDTDIKLAQLQAALLELAHQRFYRVFIRQGFKPLPLQDRLLCVLFNDHSDFIHYTRRADRTDMSWSGGYYSARTNRVAIFVDDQELQRTGEFDWSQANLDSFDRLEITGIPQAMLQTGSVGGINFGKATHEAAHQLAFNSGLQKRGVMYPLWVSEGLATNFEMAAYHEPFSPEDKNPTRTQSLIRSRDLDLLLPTLDFVTLTRLPADEPRRISALYAQSWAFFRFLFEERPAQLQHYLAQLAKLNPGQRSQREMMHEFRSSFGSIQRIDQDWHRYLAQVQ